MAKILIEIDDKRIERLNKIKNGPWGIKNLTNDELMILRGKVVQTGEWIDSTDPIQRSYDEKISESVALYVIMLAINWISSVLIAVLS